MPPRQLPEGAPRTSSRVFRVLLALALGLLALALRGWYASTVPETTDEANYVGQAEQMVSAIEAGNYSAFARAIGRNDHPHLSKFLFALRMLNRPADQALRQARSVSAYFGALAVFILALYSPPAGLLLAIQSSAIKYTGLAMLEAVPQAMIVLAVVALLRARPDRFDRYALLSAAGLGTMAAAKFTYIPLALVAAYILHVHQPRPGRVALWYYLTAGAVFLALMPPLWVAPLGYLSDMRAFHVGFVQSAAAAGNVFPWYQHFVWMVRPTPDYQELFPFSFDLPIFVAGVLGLWQLRRREGWALVWLGVGLATLLAWPNKWPQYPMLIYPALALAAARFFGRLPARLAVGLAILVVALTLRWSAVLKLPVEADSFEARTVGTARAAVDALHAGDGRGAWASLSASPATAASVAVYGGLIAVRETLRPSAVDLANYVYLGRYLNGLFSAAAVGLLASVSLPAAALLAVHSAVLGESARADSAGIALFLGALGLWLPWRAGRGRWPAAACLALCVALLPACLLVLIPMLALYHRRLLPERRQILIFAGLAALLLADVWLAPVAKAQASLAASNLPGGWWQAANVTGQTGFLSEFGSLPLALDVIIGLAGLIGLWLLPRRWAALTVAVALAVLLTPLGYRPWFLICGPLVAYSAGRALAAAARIAARSPLSPVHE